MDYNVEEMHQQKEKMIINIVGNIRIVDDRLKRMKEYRK